ncbi:MAG: hypothetical protein ABI898_01590 [Sphingomonadales bacterium]
MTINNLTLPGRARHALFAGACVLALVTTPAGAQTADANGRLVYSAEFYTTYAPSNALQIVQRTPGFRLETGNTEVRGLSQAAGNVVINGERPSSKSDTLDTILARIPASQVARVEVGQGSLFGAEYSQVSQVLNVVLTTTTGFSGTFEGALRREFTGKVLPQASASALLKRGKSTFNASIGVRNDNTSEEGIDRLFVLPSGAETEFRRKVNHIQDPVTSGSLSWAYDDGPNRSAHLNGRIERGEFALTQENAVLPAGGALRNDALTQRFGVTGFEIGGDLTRPFAGGGLKFIGLATRRHRLNTEEMLVRPGGTVNGGFAQNLDSQRDETVARLVWTRPKLGGWTVETGLEGALNTLDSKVDLFGIGTGGVRTRIDLPVDQARVEEVRGEAFINAGRSLGTGLRLDVGLTYEVSRLTVSGDASAQRSLQFLKPKATLDWRPEGGWRVQLSAERTVAQLRFEDFISSAELSSDRVNAGNAELVPQRAWQLRATIERTILGDGLVRLEFGHDFVSMVQDRIPTPEGFDAPGNLGDGSLTLAKARIDAPLDKIGIKRGRFTLYGSYVRTSVIDPYTLTSRRFSGNSDFYFEGSFRQDMGRFAYGVNFEGGTTSTNYRQNELDSFYSDIPYVSVFAEYRPNPRTAVTFGIDNLTRSAGHRDRTFFDPDRRNKVANAFEIRERNRNIIPYISFKHSFG